MNKHLKAGFTFLLVMLVGVFLAWYSGEDLLIRSNAHAAYLCAVFALSCSWAGFHYS